MSVNLPEFLSDFFYIAHVTLFLPGERHEPPFEKQFEKLWPTFHVIYRRKAFLMLIPDFEFILPDFDILAHGRGQSGGQPGVAQIEVLQT